MKAANANAHTCERWTYHADMATCPHGYELLPDGVVRRPARVRWLSHRKAIQQAMERARGDKRRG